VSCSIRASGCRVRAGQLPVQLFFEEENIPSAWKNAGCRLAWAAGHTEGLVDQIREWCAGCCAAAAPGIEQEKPPCLAAKSGTHYQSENIRA